MGTTNFAVFVDLENAGAKESMLNNIIEKVISCWARSTATPTAIPI